MSWGLGRREKRKKDCPPVQFCAQSVQSGLLESRMAQGLGSEAQRRLFEQIRQAVPLVDAAIGKITRLWQKWEREIYLDYLTNVSASQIPWAVDDDFTKMLPVMQTDIHLQKENDVLIIDAKHYSHTTQSQFNKNTIHSNNLYQIFTYVKNKEYTFKDEKHRVARMLLYAKTNAEIQPDQAYQMHGNQISVKTLDLNKPFNELSKLLDDIVDEYFYDIQKKELDISVSSSFLSLVIK